MSGRDNNYYYNPESFGLEILGQVDPGEPYRFDIVLLLRRTADGKLFWDDDSGCSCPIPFEDRDLTYLNPLPETMDEFVLEVMRNKDEIHERNALIAKVRA